MNRILQKRGFMSKKTREQKELELLNESEDWESGKRGKKNRAVSREIEEKIDEKSDLQMISIRLPLSLIKRIKTAAKAEGMKYQPYLRRLLFGLFNEDPRFVPLGQEVIDRLNSMEKEIAGLKKKNSK